MLKKTLVAVATVAIALIGAGAVAYITNQPPIVAPISQADVARSDKPYVVKLHAQWCPICMVTKSTWSRIEETYAGRVNLVVLDFTNQATTDASEAEARRLRLGGLYDEYAGATGVIAVVDGRSREITAAIGGSRDFAEYRAAIDAALSSP
jgi:thiol-disulfide isomerase/thioredoxin